MMISEQQWDFMPEKNSADVMFALRQLMGRYRGGLTELKRVLLDMGNAYDRVPRRELWYCMRKSGVTENRMGMVQDTNENVRCAAGTVSQVQDGGGIASESKSRLACSGEG